MGIIRGLFILLFLSGVTVNGFAQSRYLSRKVTVDISQCSLKVALKEIGKAGRFRFSYDADIFTNRKPVSVKVKDTQVGSLLKEMLGKEIRPREVGNHVILLRGKEDAREKQEFHEMTVTGTILDAADRKPLGEATIFEVENKNSAVSNSNGTYRVVIRSGKKVRGLTFCKSGYADTVIFISQSADRKLDVVLKSLDNKMLRMSSIRVPEVVNPTDSLGLVKWLVPRETMINSRNLEVRTSRTFQASLIPYVGTNWKVTGSVTNRFSLNLFAGYTGGLKGVEVGGLLNITRNNISGVQIGGLGNIVGGTGSGWQVGGLLNFDLGKFSGVQIGGLMNYVPDTISGVQIGGLTNIVTGRIKGVQVAGLTNVVTQNCDGWQISGLMNLTLKDSKQSQIAGLMNYARNSDGLQVAGLVNIATKYNSGVQIAGLVNYASNVHGVQIGLINISKKVERGVPIGLFSFVLEGYHLFEVSGNEIFYGNVAFKSGTRAFYNFVQFGMGSDYKLQGSYGIGTLFTLKKKLSMNIDASAGLVYHPTDTIYHGLLLKFNPALEYRFAKHFAIFGGPAYNFFLFSKGSASATPRGLSTYDFYFESTANASIQMWIGGVVGIRL